jgi:CheY-like chemotaxis protein
VAGYSGTPLPRKLGIQPGHRLVLVGAPAAFEASVLGPLPDGVRVSRRLGGTADVIVAFLTARAELQRRLPALRARMDDAAGLWIAWPKRASGVATDITEDVVRAVALPGGELVDNKVCAIDETWSGLRLVIRLSARAAGGGGASSPRSP